MSRKIFISSDISVDDRLIEVSERSPTAALMWPWLLTAFDDWGRAEASTKRLKAQVFPAQATITIDIIEEALTLYAEVGLMLLYAVGGRRYMAIPAEKWFSYQTHIRSEKREREGSRIPAPEHDDARGEPESRADARNHAQSRASARLARAGAPTPHHATPPPSPSDERDLQEREREYHSARGSARSLSLAADAPESAPEATGARPPAAIATRPAPATSERRSVPSKPVDALMDAFTMALSPPRTTSERQRWRIGAVDLHQSGITPEEVPKLVEAYRAQFGTDVPVHPKAIANNYSVLATKLGMLNGTHQSGTGSSAQAIATRAERDDADTQAQHARVAALAAQLAGEQPGALPAVPRARPGAVDSIRRAGDG